MVVRNSEELMMQYCCREFQEVRELRRQLLAYLIDLKKSYMMI